MELLKNINQEITLKLNNLIKKNYSKNTYNLLIDSEEIIVYKLENKREKALLYKKLLNNNLILLDLEENLDINIEDYLIKLGEKYLSNIYTIDDIYLEIKINDSLNSNSEIININDYTDNTAFYYMDSRKIGWDCTSYHRDCRCFMLPGMASSFPKVLEKLSFNLNLDENQLKVEEKDNYYIISLNNEILGIWSQKILDDFYDESEDIRLAESHDEYLCDDCTEDNRCKYSDPNNSFAKKLLSDELNIPIFSIDLLLKKLNREVVVHK